MIVQDMESVTLRLEHVHANMAGQEMIAQLVYMTFGMTYV